MIAEKRDQKSKVTPKRILLELYSHVSLVFSVFMVLLLFLDASDSSQQYINSYDTGGIITAYCVLIFAASVVCAAKNYGKAHGVSFILPHITIVLSLTMLTLAVTNFFNRSMGFITSDMSKMLLMAVSVAGALTSYSLISVTFSEK